MRRAARAWATIGAGALLGALTACSGGETSEDFLRAGGAPPTASDRQARVDARAAAFQIDHDAYAELGYRIDWRGFPAVGERERIRFIDMLGDALVVQETGSTVTLMEPSTGQVRWANQLAGPLTLFVGNERILDRLYISGEPELYVLNVDTGTLLDRQKYESVVSTRPIVVGRALVYGTPEGEILAHLTSNGVKYWGFDGRDAIEFSPVQIGRAIGAVTRAGDVLFVNAETGSLIGRNEIFRGPGAPLGAGSGLMFVASLDRSIYAFSPDGAELRWRYRTDTPLRQAPVEHDGVVYCDVPGEGLVALEAFTGNLKWRSSGVSGVVVGTRAGRLIAWDEATKRAFAIDPETGEAIARVTLEGVQDIRVKPFENGAMFVASESGVVARFRPRF